MIGFFFSVHSRNSIESKRGFSNLFEKEIKSIRFILKVVLIMSIPPDHLSYPFFSTFFIVISFFFFMLSICLTFAVWVCHDGVGKINLICYNKQHIKKNIKMWKIRWCVGFFPFNTPWRFLFCFCLNPSIQFNNKLMKNKIKWKECCNLLKYDLRCEIIVNIMNNSYNSKKKKLSRPWQKQRKIEWKNKKKKRNITRSRIEWSAVTVNNGRIKI